MSIQSIADYVQINYRLPLSRYDNELLEKDKQLSQKAHEQILKKYRMGHTILECAYSPQVEKMVHQLLNQHYQSSLIALSKLLDIAELRKFGYFDASLFDKYIQPLLKKPHLYKSLIHLVKQAKDQDFSPQSFQRYLNSGLFDQGIYRLHEGKTERELKRLLSHLEKTISREYGFALCERDRNFILNNHIQNEYIIVQIVIHKYRLAHKICSFVHDASVKQAIVEQLERGLNDGIPILKRIKAIAQWRGEGYLSEFLVRKYYHDWIDDLDELEALFEFLENMAEQIHPHRAIHYMELGLYEISDTSTFSEILHTEGCLFDIHDHLSEAVNEYLRIMETPGTNTSLVTNERVAKFLRRCTRCIDLIFQYREPLHVSETLPKLQECQNTFTELYWEVSKKTPRFPAPKPYGVIDTLSLLCKLHYQIAAEHLVRMSWSIVECSYTGLLEGAKDIAHDSMAQETINVFQERLDLLEKLRNHSKNSKAILEQLIPPDTMPLHLLTHYLKRGKKNKKAA